MNPNAPTDVVAALLDYVIEGGICLYNQEKTPLEYVREYNVSGLVGMIACLCGHINSSILVETDTNHEIGCNKEK